VGFVTHLVPKLTMTLDLYEIKIKDRIVGSGSLFGSGGAINSPAVLAAIIANGNVLDSTVTQTGINIFTNGLDTRTKGADFVATYSSDFDDWGRVDWSLTANYTKTEVTRIAPPPSQLAPGVSLFDKTAISNLEDTAPKYRVVFGELWSKDKWTVNLKESLYGPASQWASRTGATYYKTEIKAAVLVDLDVSYQALDSVKLSIGANNLLNKYPDRVNGGLKDDYFRANSNGYVTKFPSFSPFGINGGYYYGKITYSF